MSAAAVVTTSLVFTASVIPYPLNVVGFPVRLDQGMFVRLSPEPMNFIAVISPIVLKLPFVPNSDTISGVVLERLPFSQVHPYPLFPSIKLLKAQEVTILPVG
ncbi:MAG TPA: hypothetical protein PLM73_06230 [Petrotogaceae bacterium]|nr:hypothetical protein [Petrotogaceae bacterium]